MSRPVPKATMSMSVLPPPPGTLHGVLAEFATSAT